MNGLGLPGLANFAYHGFWTAMDWIYPPTCAGCGKPGVRWCEECQDNVITLSVNICKKCGDLISKGDFCEDCLQKPPAFDEMRSWAVFDRPVREALHRLKYRSDLGMGEIFAHNLSKFLKDLDWQFDVIIPIPLSKQHLKDRGYNQAALIAKPLALELGIPYLPKSTKRIKETTSQIHLSVEQRFANLQDAFLANPDKLNGRNILLIDDVTTTGATMSSCATALKLAGANKVFCLTVARAIKKH